VIDKSLENGAKEVLLAMGLSEPMALLSLGI
jgi:hypothetical protein